MYEVVRRLPVTTWSMRPTVALPVIAPSNESSTALHSIGRLAGWMDATDWVGPLATRLASRYRSPAAQPLLRVTTAWLGMAGQSRSSIACVPPPPAWLPSIISGWRTAVAMDTVAQQDRANTGLRAAAWTMWIFDQAQPFGSSSESIARAHAAHIIAHATGLSAPLIGGVPHSDASRAQLHGLLAGVHSIDTFAIWCRAWCLEVAEECDRVLVALKEIKRERDHLFKVAGAMRAPRNCLALAESLLADPNITVADAARTMGVTFRAAQAIVDKFASQKLLREVTGRRRDRRYECDALSNARWL